ncbi:putative gamma-secretase aspartyl protease complex, presenilin enhancer-2 subunit [Lupinus albus]|uniref:Putative gamma-secretase aspartyl protease complex, presenilin enhancer-2 subunit n=1 Tax=Lupinus albus TaxID=3870 RepID=A0A6A4PRS0_LUPAL|nr:putative gamma-secretase aspartyl protease complex, presenilin enhancer-2 subunit [Lupinus albus]
MCIVLFRSSVPVWPSIDGSLGLTEEDSLSYARNFYNFGFAFLPLLWAVNCFSFGPFFATPTLSLAFAHVFLILIIAYANDSLR